MKKTNRVVIIGMDGLDPNCLKNFSSQGLLPNFTKLIKTGFFSKLTTTTPPQSPVAWASFATSTSPAKHQIFDFIKRNKNNYLPHLTFSHALNKENPIKADSFWQKAKKKNIPTQTLFLPNTFPLPDTTDTMISGMGTPCIDGTESTCHFYFTQASAKEVDQEARSHLVVLPNQKKIKTEIRGPKKLSAKGLTPITIPLELVIKKNTLQIKVQNQTINLKPNKLSSWIEFNFKINPFKRFHAIGKFFLKSINPLKLYLSPLNFHPQNPPFSISQPKNFSAQLFNQHGHFATLGLPNDTWALEHNFLTSQIFLKEAHQIIVDREKIILNQLKNFSSGLFVAYFNTPDPVQHMFYANSQNKKDPHSSAIKNIYLRMDKTLSKINSLLEKDDLLIILSDHGFGPFNYEVHLNTILKEHSLLSLKSNTISNEFLQNTNWNKTKAYALGFNSIYLNLKGRESEGIVSPKDKKKVIKKITAVLKNLKYQKKPVVKNVYSKKDLGILERTDSPDIIVGYYQGFRASWKTAVGDLDKKAITKRTQKWSGDHLFDASEVPGILLSNQKLNLKSPSITDIASLAIKLLS